MSKSNLDQSYQEKAHAFNQAQIGRFQLKNRAEFQSVKVAVCRGLLDGGQVGAAVGLFPAIYYRTLRPIPRYGAAFGITYAAFLGISAQYRFDV